MSPCEFNELLTRYYDGELPLAQRRDFEAHLAACVPCSDELEQLGALSRSLRSMPTIHADSQFLARLDALADRVEDVGIVRFVLRLTAAAAAILMVASVQMAWHRQSVQPTSVQTVATLTASEKVIVDPESAVSVNENAGEVQVASLFQDLTGGRP